MRKPWGLHGSRIAFEREDYEITAANRAGVAYDDRDRIGKATRDVEYKWNYRNSIAREPEE